MQSLNHLIGYFINTIDPMRPSRQSAPRLIADATAVFTCQPGLMDSIRRCRTGG